MSREAASSCNYAVFTFVTDEKRDVSDPVSVVLWSPQGDWVKQRWPQEGERVGQLDPHRDIPVVNLVRDQIARWVTKCELPHASVHLSPSSDAWWEHVRELLV